MIDEVFLANYRGHKATRVPLGRFTLLVGDNAVGKTTVLEAIHLALEAVTKPPSVLYQGPRSLKWLMKYGATERMEIRLTGPQWWLSIRASDPEKPDEMTYVWSSGGVDRGPFPLVRLVDPQESEAKPLLPGMGNGAPVLRLDLRQLAQPSTSNDEKPKIEADGSGLATALFFLKGIDLERFQRLEAALRKVVPSFASLTFERVKQTRQQTRMLTVENQLVPISEAVTSFAEGLILNFTDGTPLPAHSVSEGTLLALGVLGVAHLPIMPSLLLIEDIDRGLHPRAQAELVAVLRELLDSVLPFQIVATTHSPYLADSFAPEDVVVLGRPSGGDVEARRLSEHPDKKLLKTLTSGEFLSASGKDWFGTFDT
jgi:predicted ATPase